jgi:hypothetical protein
VPEEGQGHDVVFFWTTGVRQNSIVKACVEDLQTELYMQTCAKMWKVLACLVSVYFLVISIAQRWCTIRKSLHFESRRSQSPTGKVRPPWVTHPPSSKSVTLHIIVARGDWPQGPGRPGWRGIVLHQHRALWYRVYCMLFLWGWFCVSSGLAQGCFRVY